MTPTRLCIWFFIWFFDLLTRNSCSAQLLQSLLILHFSLVFMWVFVLLIHLDAGQTKMQSSKVPVEHLLGKQFKKISISVSYFGVFPFVFPLARVWSRYLLCSAERNIVVTLTWRIGDQFRVSVFGSFSVKLGLRVWKWISINNVRKTICVIHRLIMSRDLFSFSLQLSDDTVLWSNPEVISVFNMLMDFLLLDCVLRKSP